MVRDMAQQRVLAEGEKALLPKISMKSNKPFTLPLNQL